MPLLLFCALLKPIVIKLDYKDFLDFKDIQNTILPNRIKKDNEGNTIKFLNIRIMSFIKGSTEISFKYSFADKESPKFIQISSVIYKAQFRNNYILPPKKYQ